MGTPPFAATIVAALSAAGHGILAVYTQPPRPAGRGHRLQASAVQLFAERHGLPVRCPTHLRSSEILAEFVALGAEIGVIAAYGLILPPALLAAPRLGCLNVHASLLPRWRGAAPVQRALLAGDRETGITIMQMDKGLDTGPIVMQRALPIGLETTAGELTEALARLGGVLIVETLQMAANGPLKSHPQPQEGVTYAAKLQREEGRLDWRRAAAELARQVRAFDPWPGAYFDFRGERIRVIAAAALAGSASGPPGTVLDEQLSVACREGVLRLSRLQRPGRAALAVEDFLRGSPIAAGTVLPCPATS